MRLYQNNGCLRDEIVQIVQKREHGHRLDEMRKVPPRPDLLVAQRATCASLLLS
jgi:hypothetical protein